MTAVRATHHGPGARGDPRTSLEDPGRAADALRPDAATQDRARRGAEPAANAGRTLTPQVRAVRTRQHADQPHQVRATR